MEYIVFFTAILILVGSISLALPSKSSKKISKVRMEANLLGCKISSTLYGKNKFKNQHSITASYQIKNETNLKDAHFIRDKDEFILYSPSKLKYSNEYESLLLSIRSLPESVIEIIFSEALIVFLWNENLGVDELRRIDSDLKKL